MKNLYKRAVHLCGQDAVNKVLNDLLLSEQKRRTEVFIDKVQHENIMSLDDFSEWLKMHGTSPNEIFSKCRRRELVIVRQCICYYLYRIRNYTMPYIAQIVGYSDHSTVIHARDTFEDYLGMEDKIAVNLFSTLVKQNKPEGV
jgi:chromosomal replication initiation ATPase DnaA